MQTATTTKPGNPSWKRRTGDKVHPSGTVVHWGDRDPADPYWQIGITCHRCKQRSYTHKQNVNNPAWRGFCSSCVNTPGLFRKLKGKEKLALGGEVDWEDFDPLKPKRYRVKCPNYTRCGKKEFKRIDAGNKNSQPFFCRSCFLEDRSSRMKGAWEARSKNGGNGQQNGSAEKKKRAPGRPLGSTSTDPEQTLLRIQGTLAQLKAEGVVRRNATADRIASRLGIGGDTGGDTMMKQVRKRIKRGWPWLRDFFWNGGDVSQLEFNPNNLIRVEFNSR